METLSKSIRTIFTPNKPNPYGDSDVSSDNPRHPGVLLPPSPPSPSSPLSPPSSTTKSIGEFIKLHKRISSFSSSNYKKSKSIRHSLFSITPPSSVSGIYPNENDSVLGMADRALSPGDPQVTPGQEGGALESAAREIPGIPINGENTENVVIEDVEGLSKPLVNAPMALSIDELQFGFDFADLEFDDQRSYDCLVYPEDPDPDPDPILIPSEAWNNEPSPSQTYSHIQHQYPQTIIEDAPNFESENHLTQTSFSVPQKEIVGKHHKTFSFSLPFGSTLANLDFPFTKLPSLFSNPLSTKSENHSRKIISQVQEQVFQNLNRQISISSWQEEVAYNSVKEMENNHIKAIKRTLKPKILSPNKVTGPDFPGFKGEVVIMGGYRGSILRDRATNHRVWIPIKAGFSLKKIDLTVGINDEDEYEMESKIYPDGMMTHVGPIDISRKLIKRLSSNPNVKVYEFAYDWRLSSDINSAKLVEFLKSLPSNQNPFVNSSVRRGPIVIAHSMGGLIAHHAMQQEPELFRSLVYAGVPSECGNILGPLRNGDSVLMSSKILTAQVNFLMRSSYVFLPFNGRFFTDIHDHNIKYDLDFFDVNTWIDLELSPLVARPKYGSPKEPQTSRGKAQAVNSEDYIKKLNGSNGIKPSGSFIYPDYIDIPFSQAVEFLDRTLKRTKKFLVELEYNESNADRYPPLGCLYSYSTPTLRGAEVPSKEAIRTDSYENLLFGPGDGVVYYKSLMPERKGFKLTTKVPTDRDHVSLLNDVDAVLKIISSLLENEKEREALSI